MTKAVLDFFSKLSSYIYKTYSRQKTYHHIFINFKYIIQEYKKDKGFNKSIYHGFDGFFLEYVIMSIGNLTIN